ncbi:polar amino acid transport system substrate-binding protein [Aquamicrobium terrae]
MTLRQLALVLVAILSATVPVRAAGPQPPLLWDTGERLAKPDLSALPRLRFLTGTDFPPFNFLDQAGRLSGFHIDLARAICAELALADRCQIQALPWDELNAALEKGEGEAIIAGIAATPDTRLKYAFSRSYLQFPARFIAARSAAFAEPLDKALRGKRVGVLSGSAHERMLADYFGTATSVGYTKPDDLYTDLKAGKIDAVFGDGMRLAFWLAGGEAAGCCRFVGGPYLAPEYLGTGLAIAARPGDTRLTEAFDYALQQISARGIFAELYLRYFPVSFY